MVEASLHYTRNVPRRSLNNGRLTINVIYVTTLLVTTFALFIETYDGPVVSEVLICFETFPNTVPKFLNTFSTFLLDEGKNFQNGKRDMT